MRVMKQQRQLQEVQDLRAWLARIAWRLAFSRRQNIARVPLEEGAKSLQKLYASVVASTRSDTEGNSTAPANSYHLAAEFGRAGMDQRHRFVLGGSLNLPGG